MDKSRLTLSFGIVAIALATTFAIVGAADAARAEDPNREIRLAYSRIYWEYNSSGNDLGVHVKLDGEDWTKLDIKNPSGGPIFSVAGEGPYKELGMTELFFEGAEPSLKDMPLDKLLARFPEGDYAFSGTTASGEKIKGTGVFTHAVPDGPKVFADVGPKDLLRIRWTKVASTPAGFPSRPIQVIGYQVIVEPAFEVTVPASVLSVTVSPEFVATLKPGEHKFEVVAIEAGGNQTITEGTFVK